MKSKTTFTPFSIQINCINSRQYLTKGFLDKTFLYNLTWATFEKRRFYQKIFFDLAI